jgi:hypothetical protein
VGFDRCLVAKEDYMFSEYSDVLVKFQLQNRNDNILSLDICHVVKYGVRLMYANEMHHFDLIMQGYSSFYPLDPDRVEAMFQAKRARFQGMRCDDYFGYVFPRSIR